MKRLLCQPLRLTAALISVGTGACGINDDPEGLSRRYQQISWDTLWMTTTTSAPSVWLPYTMEADERRLYVIDAATSTLVALDLHTGEQRWVSGGSGQGPGEFAQPFWLSVTASDEVIVLDRGSRRAMRFDTLGAYAGFLPLVRARGNPEALCVLANGAALVAVMGGDTIAHLSPGGEPLAWIDRPWRIVDRNGVLNQTVMDTDSDTGTCVAARMVGGHFSIYDGKGFPQLYPYVDSLKPPHYLRSSSGLDSLSHDILGVWDIEVHRDTLWVLFEGESELARRLLDAYDAESGFYLQTVVLPAPATLFAINGDVIAIRSEQSDGTDAVIGLRRKQK